ncbi:hypothetical protein WJX75_000569 [Coccomyxa subellipsoidea]|uniref:Uncharacterized protein n=1 Tax=Coccomyxa subellipsoidea TaxID=248742 RepID=A0ABR2Z2G5_9CHLO
MRLPFGAWDMSIARISHLRDVVRGPEHPDRVVRERLPILLAALPTAWRQLIQVQPPATLWCASPDPSDRRSGTGASGLARQKVEQQPGEQQTGEQQTGQQQTGGQEPGQQLQWEQQLPEPPPPPPLTFYFFGLWSSQVHDPQAWGLGPRPTHEFVVREATARRQVLYRISKGEASSAGPLRLAISADTTDDQRSGLRALEAR